MLETGKAGRSSMVSLAVSSGAMLQVFSGGVEGLRRSAIHLFCSGNLEMASIVGKRENVTSINHRIIEWFELKGTLQGHLSLH